MRHIQIDLGNIVPINSFSMPVVFVMNASGLFL